MSKNDKIKAKEWCRSCINKEMHLNLQPQDCTYLRFQHVCKCCGEVKNIVREVNIRSRYKLLLPFYNR